MSSSTSSWIDFYIIHILSYNLLWSVMNVCLTFLWLLWLAFPGYNQQMLLSFNVTTVQSVCLQGSSQLLPLLFAAWVATDRNKEYRGLNWRSWDCQFWITNKKWVKSALTGWSFFVSQWQVIGSLYISVFTQQNCFFTNSVPPTETGLHSMIKIMHKLECSSLVSGY